MLAVLFFTFLLEVGSGARILGIFHMPSQSHQILGSALLQALAHRGHDVTMVSPYPMGKESKKYRNIFLPEVRQDKEDLLQKLMVYNTSKIHMFFPAANVFGVMVDHTLSNPDVIKLKEESFDLIIQPAFFSEGILGLAHHFNAPVIYFSTIGSMASIDMLFGNLGSLAYVPNMCYGYSQEISFFRRFANTICVLISYVSSTFYLEHQRTVLLKHFPDAPSIEVLRDRVALVFLNTHYSLESPRAYVPNMVQIAGFHVQNAGPLPEDLARCLDDASDGVVLFCLGSNVQISTLPSDKLEAIVTVLGRLNMKVLFKTEKDLEKLPPNIKTAKWLPQNDILGHPNVKLFISHGGLLSTIEALYHGVPVVGLPIFGDQSFNIDGAVERGCALKLKIEELNEESFAYVIAEVLNNPKYSENLKLRSSLLREQPIRPLDKAIFWVEHVIKHKGAKHLKNAGAELAFYQHFLLDVVAFGGIIVLLILGFMFICVKKVFNVVKTRLRTLKIKKQ